MTNKNRALFCRVCFFQMLFWCGCFCEVLFCRRVIVRVFVSSHGKTKTFFFWYAILMFCIFGVTLIWNFVNFDFFYLWLESYMQFCRYTKLWHLAVCSCHVTYPFQSETTLYSCRNVKELLAQSRREIWSLSDYNWTRTQSQLVFV